MTVYRLCKSKYSKDLSGKGAEKTGARWNSKGTAMLYTCESRALCTTEIAVHTPLGNIPLDYDLVVIDVPDDLKIKEVKINDLTYDWRSFPHSHATQEIGDKFVNEGKSLILKVPSAVVQGDCNYLINTEHKDFKRIRIKSIEPFRFDERLFVR